MNTRLFSMMVVSLVSVIAMTTSAEDRVLAQKPNIIFILADDVGLGDVHCTGGHYQTPHIDALAQAGTRFEQCYAMPLCGPSRCMLLTGRYPFRTGLISNNSAAAIASHTEIMIPTVLHAAGYVTACVGKWGQMPFGPREWGFDECLSCPGSGRYWPEQRITYDQSGTMKTLTSGEYLPDLMQSFIVGFLERNVDKPFFLYYPMEHIHGPILKTPDSKLGADADQLYADNVEYMDKLVGKLVAELDRLELRKKTLIVFCGDNGTARFGVKASTVDGKAISGAKASMLEGGSRVPLIVNWPGITPAGKVLPDLVDFSDFFTTLTELGGGQAPVGVKIDGQSLIPQINGEKGTPRAWIYVELSGQSYVRDSRYKLTNTGGFFDLQHAPFEELPIPATTTDAEALTAKKALQAVLDEHPAKVVPEGSTKGKKHMKAAPVDN